MTKMWNYMHVKYFKDIVDAEEVMKVQEWVLTKRAGSSEYWGDLQKFVWSDVLVCNLP